ncbi:hydroxyisocaproate dehydrogenase [Stagonosporopsis vannaccii]|nr:hydroxyisocaproate dehydrogenase [Stagonosporopsis vannaccii]
MPKTKVVVTRDLLQGAQALLDARANEFEVVQWQSQQPCERSWLLENVKGASGLLVMVSDKVDVELLDAAGGQLKAVATYTAGTDHIDLAALKKRNVRLGYITDCLSDAVADLAVMLVLMAQRRGGEAMTKVIRGEWPQMPWHPLLMTGPQIRGATVGFIGFGRIAQASLRRLLAFGIKRAIYVTSRPGKPVRDDFYGLIKQSDECLSIPIEIASDIGQLAKESDVVIVGCALTPATKHLINDDFFDKMKKTAVIVNVARGPVIDTDALVEALDQGAIFGAGLDVIEDEPNIRADHPILRQPRCVVLPHIGSANTETREQMATESVQNLLAGLDGDVMVNEWTL